MFLCIRGILPCPICRNMFHQSSHRGQCVLPITISEADVIIAYVGKGSILYAIPPELWSEFHCMDRVSGTTSIEAANFIESKSAELIGDVTDRFVEFGYLWEMFKVDVREGNRYSINVVHDHERSTEGVIMARVAEINLWQRDGCIIFDVFHRIYVLSLIVEVAVFESWPVDSSCWGNVIRRSQRTSSWKTTRRDRLKLPKAPL